MAHSVHKRDYDVFLSHAHKDREYVEQLDRWLTNKVGFNVWYDAREMSGGSSLATSLQTGINRCRGMLLIASEQAVHQGWVKLEYNAAIDEMAKHGDFRVVAIRLDKANVDGLLMPGLTWIDASREDFNLDTAVSIIKSFYPGEKRPNPRNSHDVYMSCSWRSKDDKSAQAVKKVLIDSRFRLIGDSEDQDEFVDGNRIERIISSCGAFVSIIPYRNSDSTCRSEGPYKYFMQELDCATELGLPCIVIADPRVKRSDGSDKDWLRMETTSDQCSEDIQKKLDALWDEWMPPISPQYIFCAMDLDDDAVNPTGPFRSLIERVTGMQTKIGNEITKQPIHSSIMDEIKNAFLVIADISDDNLNTCIEAGIALCTKTNTAILSEGASRRPPFMLRSLQLSTYMNQSDQIGLIHKIIWPYRRRVINAEM